MVLIGVQLAQVLTILLAAACVLLCLLAWVAHFRHPTRRPAPQRIVVGRTVRREVGLRPSWAERTPLPSRGPPGFSRLFLPDYDGLPSPRRLP